MKFKKGDLVEFKDTDDCPSFGLGIVLGICHWDGPNSRYPFYDVYYGAKGKAFPIISRRLNKCEDKE